MHREDELPRLLLVVVVVVVVVVEAALEVGRRHGHRDEGREVAAGDERDLCLS